MNNEDVAFEAKSKIATGVWGEVPPARI